MNSKEEFNTIKKEDESVNKTLCELTEENLEHVSGGVAALAPDPFVVRPLV